jgi:hypothetical protein
MPSTSDKLTAAEIAQVARSAGFSESAIPTAVAVALAESSGRTKAVSPTGCCHGLWQINVNVHPYTKAQMQDPAQNAAAAKKISNNGTNWKPWSAYTNGSYLLYMTSARNASRVRTDDNNGGTTPQQSGGDILIDELSGAVDGIQGITYPITATKEWLSDRNNIFRIVKVLAGGAIAILGLKLIVKEPVMAVIKEVKK